MKTKHAAASLNGGWRALAGLLLVGTLQASADDIQPSGDDQLRRAAEEAVRSNPFLGVFDHVLVEVNGGQVRLWGSVEQRCRREKAASSVARLSGVLDVQNDIEVQSSAPEDVMLRRRLFERLYYDGGIGGNDRLEWPVRILVSHGRVTLAGEITENAERERLEAIAQSAGARFVETRLQTPITPTQVAASPD
ncbi:MAG TPA: BON domain-containing protein [Vicinamibacteria bacterium]|nr:BON domain-containing protein [Vicinamibacteria bacterium]